MIGKKAKKHLDPHSETQSKTIGIKGKKHLNLHSETQSKRLA